MAATENLYDTAHRALAEAQAATLRAAAAVAALSNDGIHYNVEPVSALIDQAYDLFADTVTTKFPAVEDEEPTDWVRDMSAKESFKARHFGAAA
jgi:hypothetical protein